MASMPQSSIGGALLAPTGPAAYASIAPVDTGASETGSRRTIIDEGDAPQRTSDGVTLDPHLAMRRLKLDFVDTDIREFARVLFSEMLEVPYTIDPNMAGVVTVRSGAVIDGNRALSLARQALESTGYALRLSNGVYRIMAQNGGGYESGGTKSFTLAHISAAAAQEALGGFLDGRAQIIPTTNHTISVRGDAESVALMESLLASIDIDRFRSASFGLFPLTHARAPDVANELSALYAGADVTGQTILPLERINAVLLIAPTAQHLSFARNWLERLDQGPLDERRIYVYEVKNRGADELAPLLIGMFSGSPTNDATVTGGEAASITAPNSFLNGGRSDAALTVTADKGANKLLIRATPDEYDRVVAALGRLDTAVSQVYVEATIAEVRLNNELSHGVRWFLQANAIGAGFSDADNGAIAPSFPGFNASLQVPHARIVLSMLESRTDVRIVSTPQLTVVDRQTAMIQVGDQVPVVTKSVADASSGETVIASDVSFRDTGIILKVTPQIRSSGDVLLDIEQEVSRVVPTTSSTINSPTISQRKVSSTVLVPDGTAIVLAGLMSASDESGTGGPPGTSGTLLEAIFGTKKVADARSELIAIIRPVIIRDRSDLRDVAAEVAAQMQSVMLLDAH